MLESILESYSQSLLKANNSLRHKAGPFWQEKALMDKRTGKKYQIKAQWVSESQTRETWQMLMSSDFVWLVSSLWRILVVLCNGIISVHRWRYEQEVHQETLPHIPLALPLVLSLLQHLFLAQIHCVPPAKLLRASALSLCVDVALSPDVFAVMMFYFASINWQFYLPFTAILWWCHVSLCLTMWSIFFWIQPKEVPHQGDSGVSRSMRCVSISLMNTKLMKRFSKQKGVKIVSCKLPAIIWHNVSFKAGLANLVNCTEPKVPGQRGNLSTPKGPSQQSRLSASNSHWLIPHLAHTDLPVEDTVDLIHKFIASSSLIQTEEETHFISLSYPGGGCINSARTQLIYAVSLAFACCPQFNTSVPFSDCATSPQSSVRKVFLHLRASFCTRYIQSKFRLNVWLCLVGTDSDVYVTCLFSQRDLTMVNDANVHMFAQKHVPIKC